MRQDLAKLDSVFGLPAAKLRVITRFAGGAAPYPPWAVATGWADLDRAEVLRASHRFPVYQLTMLVTATTVLRIVADGRRARRPGE